MRGHFITAGAALAAGLTAGLAAGGAPEVAAEALTRKVTVQACYPNADPAIGQIWKKVDTAMCSLAETEAGFAPGECAIETGTVASFTRGDDETCVSTSFMFAGNWAKRP